MLRGILGTDAQKGFSETKGFAQILGSRRRAQARWGRAAGGGPGWMGGTSVPAD